LKLLWTIVITVVLTLAVAGLLGAWATRHFVGGEKPLVVRVEPVQRGTVIETVTATGIVEPQSKVSISAKVTARIVELPHKVGDRVTRGDPNANPPIPPSVLVRLDANELESQLKSAEARRNAQQASIAVAEARLAQQEAQIRTQRVQLDDAKRDLERQKGLLASRDVSQATVDSAQAKVDALAAQLDSATHGYEADKANLVVMRHNLEAAEADIQRVRDDLTYTTITSPIDGVIIRLNAEVGELVVTGTMNNPGTVVLEVADLSTMLLKARIDETAVAELEVGQPAVVRMQAYRDKVFKGKVQSIALAQTDEKDGTRHYKAEILLETEERLFSGLTGDVDIETRRHDGVLRVPSQAVVGRAVDELPQGIRERPEVDQRKTFATVVYRMIDGKAVVTPVKVGSGDVTHVIIESGLEEGERVVVGPYKALESLRHDQRLEEESATTRATEP
jgi:HlyD family secretion protein